MDTTVQTRLGCGSVRCIAASTIGSGLGATDQIRDEQLLMDDQVVVIDEAPRKLVQRVGATIPDPAVRRRDSFHTATPALRASLLCGQVLLGSSEALRGALGMAVVGDQGPVASRHQHAHAQVDPDLTARRRQALGRDVDAADDDPPASASRRTVMALGIPRIGRCTRTLSPPTPNRWMPGRLVDAPSAAVLPLQ
jgi:hypothetical protein